MPKVIVVGDLHGDFAALNKLIKDKRPGIVLQCGDFGFWPGHRHFDPAKWLKPGQCRVHFADGNHENHNALAQAVREGRLENPHNVFYQPRGSVLTLPDGQNVLFAGGALSVDNLIRIPSRDWFPDLELLTGDDLTRFPDPKQVQIDIVVSHTAPREFHVQGLPYGSWPSWWDRTPDLSAQTLSIILKDYKPARWYLGHFHTFQEGEFDGCRWTALSYAGALDQWWVAL